MKKQTWKISAVCGLLLSALMWRPVTGDGAEISVVAPGAKIEKLADGFEFTEGPASDANGNVFFTDQPTNRILKWNTEGQLSTFLQPSGRANGLCFDSQGNLWAAADENNQLWRIDPTGQATIVLKDYAGKLFNGPNDIWIRPDGGLYFSDPFYKRPYWNRGPMEQAGQGIYYLAPGGEKAIPVVIDLKQSNGLIGSADGKRLYVADLGAGKTNVYNVQPNGTLTDKKLFCDMGSDGMTIDNENHVYLTGNGVSVFDQSGRKIEQIAVPEGWTSNVCFGGQDRQTLFITAGKSLYSIRMRTKGVGSQ